MQLRPAVADVADPRPSEHALPPWARNTLNPSRWFNRERGGLPSGRRPGGRRVGRRWKFARTRGHPRPASCGRPVQPKQRDAPGPALPTPPALGRAFDEIRRSCAQQSSVTSPAESLASFRCTGRTPGPWGRRRRTAWPPRRRCARDRHGSRRSSPQHPVGAARAGSRRAPGCARTISRPGATSASRWCARMAAESGFEQRARRRAPSASVPRRDWRQSKTRMAPYRNRAHTLVP